MQTFDGPEVTCRFKVPFHDLDPLHVMWHGNYFKYFDRTRFALFESVGIDLYADSMARGMAFPITRWSVKHILPLRFNDAFSCRAVVQEAQYKIVLLFEIRLSRTGAVCARAKSDQVAVSMPDMELALEIPEDIRNALGFA